jgi:hypothetical protein
MSVDCIIVADESFVGFHINKEFEFDLILSVLRINYICYIIIFVYICWMGWILYTLHQWFNYMTSLNALLYQFFKKRKCPDLKGVSVQVLSILQYNFKSIPHIGVNILWKLVFNYNNQLLFNDFFLQKSDIWNFKYSTTPINIVDWSVVSHHL